MNKRIGFVKIILLVVVLLLVALIAAFLMLKPPANPLPAATEAAMPVSTITVHPTSLEDIVYLPAMIEAKVDATLSAEKAGRVVEIKVDRGSRVERGGLLLQIDDRIWQTSLKQATIAAENATRDYNRAKSLMETGALSQSEYDRAEQAYVQTASAAEEARINIEQCRVESPVDGIVNDRFVEAGEYVQPGTPLFQVIDKATVRVVLQVPEKDIFAIKEGNRIAFTVQPLPEKTFEGTVSFVAPQADDRNNAFRAELAVDNGDGLLRPGMIAQVKFKRGISQNMVTLPMAAVLPSKGEHIVFLAKDGQAVRRRVQIDTIARRDAIISGGLEEGDLVIVDGNRTLSDGQRIEIIEPESLNQ